MAVERIPVADRDTTFKKVQQVHYDMLAAKYNGDVDGNADIDTISSVKDAEGNKALTIVVTRTLVAVHPWGDKYSGLAVDDYLFCSHPTQGSIKDVENSVDQWIGDITG